MAGMGRGLRYEDSFWGEKDAGFDVILNRMRSGKQTCKDIIEIVAAHSALEEEYAKKLAKLAKMAVGKDEVGTFREALISLRTELDQSAQLHANIALDLRAKVDKPLVEFTAQQSKTRKAKAKVMARIHKTKLAQQSLVLKTRQAFQKRAQEAEQLTATLRRPGLAAKDAERIAVKERKAVTASQSSDNDFAKAVDKLKRVQEEWVAEMRDTANLFQRLDEERLAYLKEALLTYTTVLAEAATNTEQSCQRVRASLEECNVETDIDAFVNSHTTGTDIPDPPDYETERALIVGVEVRGRNSVAWRPQSMSFARGGSDDEGSAPPTSAPPKKNQFLFKVRALYDYDPQGPEELALKEGDIVEVISNDEDPWWEGRLKNKSGMFPSNFVERVQ